MTKPPAGRVQKLHLVGHTTDHDGLILSARRGARSGGYVLEVDDAVAEAIDAYRARKDERGAPSNGRSDRAESRLPISEIQARLRRGKSIKDIAKDAGVSPEWVERFSAPVLAERARVIDYVRLASLRRPRLGQSSQRVGDAIRSNLAERGVAISQAEFDDGWTSQQLPNGKWTVRFKVRYRGADKTLRFDLKGVGAEIVAHDQLTQQLSYVAPPIRKPTPVKAAAVPVDDDGKKRAVVSTGFRPDPDVKPVSRPAKERERAAKEMSKAAARRAGESERAAARKARERAQALAKQARQAEAEASRREKEDAARKKAVAAAARVAADEAARRERELAVATAARNAERARVREAARQRAVKAVKSRQSPKGAAKAAAKAKAKPADKARTAAAVRKRSAAAEEAARKRAVQPRLPTATTEAKSSATAAAKAPARKPASQRAATRPTSEPRPTAAARVDPARLAEAGAAVEAYGPEATRALFRAGLAERAAPTQIDDTAETPRPEVAPEQPVRPEVRLMGRRRRRQLRAN